MLGTLLANKVLDQLDMPAEKLLQHLSKTGRARNCAKRQNVEFAWQLALQNPTVLPHPDHGWRHCGHKTVQNYRDALLRVGADLYLEPHNTTILHEVRDCNPPDRLKEKWGFAADTMLWVICGDTEDLLLRHDWELDEVQVLKTWLASLGLKLGMTAREVFHGLTPTERQREPLTALQLQRLASSAHAIGVSPGANQWIQQITGHGNILQLLGTLRVIEEPPYLEEIVLALHKYGLSLSLYVTPTEAMDIMRLTTEDRFRR